MRRPFLLFAALLAACTPRPEVAWPAGPLPAAPRLLPIDSAPGPAPVDPGPALMARGEALRQWAAQPLAPSP